MDDINRAAAKITLDLVIDAVESLVCTNHSLSREDNEKTFDYVLNHVDDDFEENLQFMMNAGDPLPSFTGNELSEDGEKVGIDESNVESDILTSVYTEVGVDLDHWKSVCQADDLDYQDDCIRTKGWVSEELENIKRRAGARSKLLEAAKKETFTVGVQSIG